MDYQLESVRHLEQLPERQVREVLMGLNQLIQESTAARI